MVNVRMLRSGAEPSGEYSYRMCYSKHDIQGHLDIPSGWPMVVMCPAWEGHDSWLGEEFRDLSLSHFREQGGSLWAALATQGGIAGMAGGGCSG